MKILILNQVFYPDPAATAQHVGDLAKFLVRQGCEVTVLCDRRGYEKRDQVHPKKEVYNGVRIQRVNSSSFGKTYLRGRILDALSLHFFMVLRLFRMPKQDVVLAFTSPPMVGFWGALFCLLKGGKLVQWLMDINLETAVEVGYLKRQSIVVRCLRGLFRFVLARSDSVVVLDRWMKKRAKSLGAREDRISIVPPWPVHKAPKTIIKKSENSFAREHGLEDKFVVLYSGNHSVVHPLDTLLDAATLLKDRKDIRFVFIGSGLRVHDVTRRKERDGLENILQLPIQPRERLGETLSCADLHVVVMGDRVSGLVHPSKIYGVLATGKPYLYVGPKESFGVDILNQVPCGFHVEHGEPKRIVEVIENVRLLSDAELNHFRERNIEYVDGFSAQKSLTLFARQVLQLVPQKLTLSELQPETASLI